MKIGIDLAVAKAKREIVDVVHSYCLPAVVTRMLFQELWEESKKQESMAFEMQVRALKEEQEKAKKEQETKQEESEVKDED